MPFDQNEIQSALGKLRKSLKRPRHDLVPENVHKLRTRIRRFESMIDATGLLSKKQSRLLLDPLQRIRQKAGRVRDMDVLTSQLASVCSHSDRSCLIQLFEYLGSKRYRRAARLRRLLRAHAAALRKALRKVSKNVSDRKTRGASDDKAQATASWQVVRLSRDLAQPLPLSRANLHAYRLKVKRLYDLVLLESNEERGPSHKFTDTLRIGKDAIGEWHDSEQLIAIARKVLDHQPRCALVQELKTVSKRKYDRALAAANKIRNSCVTPSKSVERPEKISRPALRLVSSLIA